MFLGMALFVVFIIVIISIVWIIRVLKEDKPNDEFSLKREPELTEEQMKEYVEKYKKYK